MPTLRAAIDAREMATGAAQAVAATSQMSAGANTAAKSVDNLDRSLTHAGAAARTAAAGAHTYFDGAQLVTVSSTQAAAQVQKMAPAARQAADGMRDMRAAAAQTGQDLLRQSAVWVGAFVGSTFALRRMVDEMDAIGKASEKIGAPVEFISAIAYQADLANTNLTEVLTGLKQFARQVEAAERGSKTSKGLFASIGVDPSAATDGNAMVDAYLATADAIAALEDGTKKADAAQQLFGRSGLQLVPLLNEGSAGFRQAAEEARKFGVELSAKQTDQAGRFNDEMDRLKATMKGLAVELVPLVTITASFLRSILQNEAAMALLKGSVLTLVAGFVTFKALQIIDLFFKLAAAIRLAATSSAVLVALTNPAALAVGLAAAAGAVILLNNAFDGMTDIARKATDGAKDRASADEEAAQATRSAAEEIMKRNAELKFEVSLMTQSEAAQARARSMRELDAIAAKSQAESIKALRDEHIKLLDSYARGDELKAIKERGASLDAEAESLGLATVSMRLFGRAIDESAIIAGNGERDLVRLAQATDAVADSIARARDLRAVAPAAQALNQEFAMLEATAFQREKITRFAALDALNDKATTASARVLLGIMRERTNELLTQQQRTAAVKSIEDLEGKIAAIGKTNEAQQRLNDLKQFELTLDGLSADEAREKLKLWNERYDSYLRLTAVEKARTIIEDQRRENALIQESTEARERQAKITALQAATAEFAARDQVYWMGLLLPLLDQGAAARERINRIEKEREANKNLDAEIRKLEKEIEILGLIESEREAARAAFTVGEQNAAGDPVKLARVVELLQQKNKLEQDDKVREKAKEERTEIEKLIKNLEFELTIVSKTNAERERAIGLREIETTATKLAADEVAELSKRYGEAFDALTAANRRKELADSIAEPIARGVEEAIVHFENLRDIAQSVFEDIQRAVIRAFVTQPLQQALTSGLQSGFGAINLFGSANGNVFDRGRVVPFAHGGIVDQTNLFPMSDGRIGMVGERGPEAIVPLPDGRRIPVEMRGGGGGNVQVGSINITIQGSARREDVARGVEDGMRHSMKQRVDDARRGAGM